MERARIEYALECFFSKYIVYILLGLTFLMLINQKYLLYINNKQLNRKHNELNSKSRLLYNSESRFQLLKEYTVQNAQLYGTMFADLNSMTNENVPNVIVTIDQEDYKFVIKNINYIITNIRKKHHDVNIMYYHNGIQHDFNIFGAKHVTINSHIIEKFSNAIILTDFRGKIIHFTQIPKLIEHSMINHFLILIHKAMSNI